ncbi:MAG: FAD-dependent monooxygenase [Hyphomicrobiaceae bacterium]
MTPTSSMFDVVIAGGSFAGLALALALVRAKGGGPEVAVIEREELRPEAHGGRADPRAFALSAGSRRLLEAIGVWDAVADQAQPVAGIDITDSALADAFRPVLLSYATSIGGEPQMLILEADRLKQALHEAVLGEPRISVMAPCEVAGLAEGAGGRMISLRNGERVAARLVVAADGSRSRVRELVGIGVVGGSFRQRGIATIVGHEGEHEGRAVQHFLPAGPFALLPLQGRRSCITWSEREARAEEIMKFDDVAFLDEAQARAGWRLGALSLEGGRASWPLRSHLARSLIGPRIALVGDAARSVHPIAGQGVNLGFRDVAALAETVIEGMRLGLEPGDATSLTRYERWRRADGAQSAAAFSALNSLFSNDWTALRTLRDAGLGLVDRLPGLKGLLVAEAAGATGDVPRLLRGQPL